jgi:hypothetical protein
MDDETINPAMRNAAHLALLVKTCIDPEENAKGVFLYNKDGKLSILTFNAGPIDVFNMAVQTAHSIEQSVNADMPPREMFN